MKWKVALAVLLMIAGVMVFANAEEAETFTCGDYEYTLAEDGTAVITWHKGKDKNITIPQELDGHSVKGIGDGAFSDSIFGNYNLTSVTLPDSITDLGANPWRFCTNLTTIKVSPKNPSLAVIDGVLYSKADKRLVWYPMTSKASIFEVPQGIRIIGDEAFYDCDNLTSITLPDSITSIGENTFYRCDRLTSITLPDGITSIGNRAFSWCRSLTSITLPESITSIGENTFYRCDRLTSITLPYSLTSIGDLAFFDCESLTSITLPDSITSIGDGAFFGCISLTSITLPDSITYIGNRAFSSCNSLTLTVTEDSYAEQYCIDNGLTYIYPNSLDWLND